MTQDVIEEGGQQCPMCARNTLTLREERTEIPYFGAVYVFSMTCSECHYHKSDVEPETQHDPCKYSLEISSEEDLKIRVVKSSEATIKIPRMISVTPGPASDGFVTNVEGVLNRIKSAIESARDGEEDTTAKKKAKNHLKKLTKVMWGQETLTLTIEDPTGNSAIISDKAKKSKL